MASDPQKSLYMVKFLFADASFIEESFAADITVNDAKQKLISIWPAGKKQTTVVTLQILKSFLSHLFVSISDCYGLISGKDPITGPDDVRMIYAGKVLENTKSFQGSMPAQLFPRKSSFE
jgi:hypothetical protein